MEASRAADAPIYTALVDEYGARVYSLALVITGSCALADETTEAVFREIRTQPAHFHRAGRTGVIRLAGHHAARRARAQRAASTASAEGHSQHTSPLLEQLPPEAAAAITVTYFEGRTLQQAAEILDQPVPVLVARIRSGLAAVRRTTIPAQRRGY